MGRVDRKLVPTEIWGCPLEMGRGFFVVVGFFLLFVCLLAFVFQTGSPCVAQAGLKLVILLSQPPKYGNYRCAP
jgi:hypothetical protein